MKVFAGWESWTRSQVVRLVLLSFLDAVFESVVFVLAIIGFMQVIR